MIVRPYLFVILFGTVSFGCALSDTVSVGRPCSETEICGPDAVCDLVSGICVSKTDALMDAESPGDRLIESEGIDLGCTCEPGTSDRCIDGQCVCGDSGSACTNGKNCVGGVCICLVGTESLCFGCCSNGECILPSTGQSDTRCGKGGVECVNCVDGMACILDGTCINGVCTGGTEAKDGAGCGWNQQCRNGACETDGCWRGSNWYSGTALTSCGKNGGTCTNCSSGDPCIQNGTCNAGTCVGGQQADDGTACGTNQKCRDGTCETSGCWSGATWTSGTALTACGKGGLACKSCKSSDVCKTDGVCSSGVCTGGGVAKPEGTVCGTNLKCHSGACVSTGCWTGTAWHSGTSAADCGSGGGECRSCLTSDPCKTDGTCSSGACSGGGANEPDGTECGSGKKCRTGVCETSGCWNNSTWFPGTAVSACGSGGGACVSCTSASECKTDGTCPSGACVAGTNKTEGTACGAGATQKCHEGACETTGCWSGTTWYSGTATDHCGKDGLSCSTCSTGIPCKTDDTCVSGVCSGGGANVAEGTGCGGTNRCHSGECMTTGCWFSTPSVSWHAGNENTACGCCGAWCTDCAAASKVCDPAGSGSCQ